MLLDDDAEARVENVPHDWVKLIWISLWFVILSCVFPVVMGIMVGGFVWNGTEIRFYFFFLVFTFFMAIMKVGYVLYFQNELFENHYGRNERKLIEAALIIFSSYALVLLFYFFFIFSSANYPFRYFWSYDLVDGWYLVGLYYISPFALGIPLAITRARMLVKSFPIALKYR